MQVATSIFLVGMMGAGKTRCGKQLAQLLGLPFIDMDHALEAAQGMSVSAIFTRMGEPGFRQLEHEWLLNFAGANAPAVVSTGGGAPCFNNNMDLMNEAGITVWLKPSLPELIDRLWRNKEDRPKIAAMRTVEELEHYIRQLLEERGTFYSRAKLVVEQAPPDIPHLQAAISSLL